MKELLRKFYKEEDGMGTVEIVIIVAILVGLALVFGKAIKGFVQDNLNTIKGKASEGVNDAFTE